MADSDVIAFLETVLHADPDDIKALVKLGWLYESERHDGDAAVSHLHKAMSVDPDSADASFWLAQVYYHDCARLELAQEALEHALSLDSDHVPSLSLLSSVFRDRDMPERAIPLIERALMLAPSWVMLHAEADCAYLDVKNFELSASHAREAARLAEKFHKVSTPGAYCYFEAAVTGRWVDDETLAHLHAQARRSRVGPQRGSIMSSGPRLDRE